MRRRISQATLFKSLSSFSSILFLWEKGHRPSEECWVLHDSESSSLIFCFPLPFLGFVFASLPCLFISNMGNCMRLGKQKGKGGNNRV